MTASSFLELALSLAIQISIVIGVCGWLVRQSGPPDSGHRLWGMCHVMILCLTVSAVLFPHLRLIPHSIVSDHVPLPVAATAQEWAGRALFAIWGIGALLYVAALSAGILAVRRVVRSGEPVAWHPELGAADVRILASRDVAMPFCWQMQQPIIIVPDHVRKFPDDELGAILRHELAHLRSAHPLFLFLQRVVESLYWFHPLVWWASRQANLHREFHCDRQSVRSAVETASYLRSLLRLSEAVNETGPSLSAGLEFRGSRSDLKLRVEWLVRDRTATPSGASRPGAAAVAATALAAACVWLPVDVTASSRSLWSPWPTWSARALHEAGISARDYEVDGHRLRPHELEDEVSSGAQSVERL